MPTRPWGGIGATLLFTTAVPWLAAAFPGFAAGPAYADLTCQDGRRAPIARAVATEGMIVPRLVTAPPRPLPGQELRLSVVVDMSGCSYVLGSYGARLRWDPKALELLEVTGGTTGGFTSPVVNRTGAAEGEIRFAHANPQGASGDIEILRVRLRALRALPKPDKAFQIEFTSMGGIGPKFEDLKTLLQADGRGHGE